MLALSIHIQVLCVVVQPPNYVWLSVTSWTITCQASLSLTISQSLPKFMSIESVMSSNHFILCCPLLLLTSIFPSIRVLSNELAIRIRWPKYWSFSIGPSNGYSGLISFKIDWFDLLAVQGTLKSLLQRNNMKALILQYSALFMANSHIHMWLALIIQTLVSKVISLLLICCLGLS